MTPIPPPVDRAAGTRAAIAARRARAAVKQSIAHGERMPLEVLDAAVADQMGPEGTLRVPEFLAAIPRMGPTRAAVAMERLGIATSKRLGGLGVQQRVKLADWLADRQTRLPGGHPDTDAAPAPSASTVPSGATPSRTGVGDTPGATVQRHPALVVLAGPTAVGKGTVAAHIRDHHPEVLLSVSATTRAPRPGEIDGTHYYFVDDAEFDRMVDAGELLEWATVHNSSRYGTPRGPVEEAIAAGRSVLLEIDLQGARQVRRSMPSARLVFLLPPTWDELVRRLTGRGTETAEQMRVRLETARHELAAQDEFDHLVVNDDVARAAADVVDFMESSEVS